jgi:hypothetical protein
MIIGVSDEAAVASAVDLHVASPIAFSSSQVSIILPDALPIFW